MDTTIFKEKIEPLLNELQIKNTEEIIKDYLITEILYKISEFKDEIEKFDKKYKKPFEKVKKEYQKNEENFEIFDDLNAWKFAIDGYNYWNKKLKELESVF